jgi:membrane-associated phospholipid phosphatase
VRPVELLNFGALLLVTAVAFAARGRLSDPSEIFLRYAEMAAGLAVIAFLAARADGLPEWLRFLLDFYPAAFIPILYETLGPVIAAARGGPRDEILIAADRALFGRDVTVWLERFVRPALTNFFYLSYTSYYFISLALGIVLYLRSRRDLARLIFTLTVCYYVSYAGYFAVPALGPRFALAASQTVPLETTALSASIARTLDELEHTKFDVFPSGHTMIAVTVLLVAFRRARDVFWALLPIATCLILSTVYCRYHYVVDVIAGTILAVATVPLGDALYERWTAGPEPEDAIERSYIR